MTIDMPPMLSSGRWSIALREAIEWGAAVDTLQERCGFFWQPSSGELRFQPMHNNAIHPEKGFTFSTVKAIHIMGGMVDSSFVGLFHTHPGGSAEPSGLDLQFAKQLEGSVLGSGLEHWLFAAGSPQTLTRYDSEGVLAHIKGQFVLD